MDKDKEIIKRIKVSEKKKSKEEQRALLIARLPQFRKEANGIIKVIGKDFLRKYHITVRSWRECFKKDGCLPAYTPLSKKELKLWDKWGFFLNRWGVCSEMYKDDSIRFFSRTPIAISYKKPNPFNPGCINIRINNQTTLQHIKNIWPKIERFQKEYLSYKSEDKPTFSRDLCWYDLHTKYNLSPRKIADLWNKYHPEDINLIVIKRVMRNDKETSLEGTNPRELLEDIKVDPKKYPGMKDLISNFKEEREHYLYGKSGNSKVTAKVLNLVKSGINRIKNYIEDLSKEINHYDDNIPPSDYPYEEILLDYEDTLLD